ncbi:MAG: phytase [Actinomycetota bacterium]|nr:phytase [Actinomycetota bacterium]
MSLAQLFLSSASSHRKRRGVPLVLVLLIALILPSTVAPAAATTTNTAVTAGADAHVNHASPTKNYGTATTLVTDGSPVKRGYLRFTIPASTDPLERATLRLYVKGSTKAFDVHSVGDTSWKETGITWNNKPALGPVVARSGAVTVGTWVSLDVTAAVPASGLVSFGMSQTSSTAQSVASRESSSTAPVLVLERGAAGDTEAPKVSIASPTSGASYTSDATVAVTASASDNVGVRKVEFFFDGVLRGTEDTSPFSYTWMVTSADNGSHTWTARAYDSAGNTTTSAPISVSVNIPTTSSPSPSPSAVTAQAETTPVPNSGDAADDPAVWVHPTDPSLSTVIGADKLGGLAVYDLSGKQLHYYADNKPNNVDVRYNFPLGGQRVTIVTTSDHSTDTIRIYTVDPASRGLKYVAARSISVGIGLYGLCMYRSPSSGKYYVIDSDSSGTVQQWELFDNGSGLVDARKVRSFHVGSTTEGCVADDETGQLYIAEEDVAIWKYGAEPGAGTSRTKVDAVTSAGGRLTADIEGLSLYYASNGTGYLLASSQGSNDYVVYERQGDNRYVTRFGISAGAVDAVSYTDGIDVLGFGLGSVFPEGVFIAQDDRNDNGNQNFKLVSWGTIARGTAAALTVDTSWDPRRVGGSSTSPTITEPPAVQISAPTSGMLYDQSQTVTISASASASAGVKAVEFYDNGVLHSSDTSSPYTAAWTIGEAQNGTHRWTAKVTDGAGATATSALVDVTVAIATATGPAPATGTTYYLDSVGGNDSAAGTTPEKAWKSLSKASSAPLLPGDRLLLRRGASWTGALSLGKSGTASAPISIGSYGTGTAPVVTGSSSCVRVSGSHTRVSDLHVRGCTWAGISISGNANVVEGNHVTDTAAGVYVKEGATGNKVLRNELIDNNRMSVLTHSPTNDDSGAFGVLLRGDNTEVAYNTISGSDAFSYDYGRDGAAVEVYGAQGSDVHHNTARDNDVFTELGNSRAANNRFAYNLVTSSLDTSVFLVTRGAGSSYGPILNTVVENNTVVMTGASSQGFVCHAGCSTEILTVRNSIITAVRKVGYADSPFVDEHNVYHGGPVQFALGATSVVAVPGFLDASARNYRLAKGSVAVDRGVERGYTHDLDGAPLPVDGDGDGIAQPDRGAFERSAGA